MRITIEGPTAIGVLLIGAVAGVLAALGGLHPTGHGVLDPVVVIVAVTACVWAGLLLASGLVLNWLIRQRHKPVLGLHFTWLGLGVAVSGLAVAAMAGHSSQRSPRRAVGSTASGSATSVAIAMSSLRTSLSPTTWR